MNGKMEKITSPNNPRLKAAIKLCSSRGRKKQNRAIVFGKREIERAILARVKLVEIFFCTALLHDFEINWLNDVDSQLGPSRIELSIELFEKLAYGDRQDGLIAVIEPPSTRLADLELELENRSTPLSIGIVQSVEKPGNLGAVIRSADGAGIDALFVADPLCDPFHPNCIRASLGTVFSSRLVCGSSREILNWLNANAIEVFATRVDAELSYHEADLSGPAAIAIGNEAVGLTAEWQDADFTPIHIPMSGVADSLNLSVSAAIVFYELKRQRTGS